MFAISYWLQDAGNPPQMHPEDSFTSRHTSGTRNQSIGLFECKPETPDLLWMRNKSVIQTDLKTLWHICLLNNASVRLYYIIIHSSVFLTDSRMPGTRHKCILKTVSLRNIPAALGTKASDSLNANQRLPTYSECETNPSFRLTWRHFHTSVYWIMLPWDSIS